MSVDAKYTVKLKDCREGTEAVKMKATTAALIVPTKGSVPAKEQPI